MTPPSMLVTCPHLSPHLCRPPQAISVHCGLLLLAVVAVILPSMLVATHTQATRGTGAGAAAGGGIMDEEDGGGGSGRALLRLLPPSPLDAASLHLSSLPSASSSLMLSRFESVLMLCLYALFLVFQLCTHK